LSQGCQGISNFSKSEGRGYIIIITRRGGHAISLGDLTVAELRRAARKGREGGSG